MKKLNLLDKLLHLFQVLGTIHKKTDAVAE